MPQRPVDRRPRPARDVHHARARAPARQPGQGPTREGYVLFADSFALPEGQTLEEALSEFDAAAEVYLAGIRGTDPDAPDVEPPAPWAGIVDPIPTRTRFYLLHQIEELARHAGHADIIREQLDGALARELAMAAAGAPANDFAKPWQPPDR